MSVLGSLGSAYSFKPDFIQSSRIQRFIRKNPPRYNIIQIVRDALTKYIIYNIAFILTKTPNTPSGYFELKGQIDDIINYNSINVEIISINNNTIIPKPFIQPILTSNNKEGKFTMLISNDYKDLTLHIILTAVKRDNITIIGNSFYYGFTNP